MSLPLVTAIMPTTAARAAFWPQAFESFLSQDWPHKELLVLFGGPGAPPEAPHPSVRVELYHGKEIIGLKRNACCEQARGEFILHWDDDDWSAPGRILHQVGRLLETGKAVAAYNTVFFWNDRQLFEWGSYRSEIGSSLCYRRAWWEKNRFNPLDHTGEDNTFMGKAKKAVELESMPHEGMMVCRIHPGNTSHKHPNSTPYKPLPSELLPAGFPRDVLAPA